MPPVKHYINLTNGIEALGSLPASEPWSFIRLQSTTIERQDWLKLFGSDLDHDFFMHLALGFHCILHDRGTRRKNSKTVYYGVPLVRYILNRCWYGLTPEVALFGRGGMNGAGHFDAIYCSIFEHKGPETGAVKRRLNYYRRFTTGPQVHLEGSSEATEHDSDVGFYVDLVRRSLGLSVPGAAEVAA